MFPSHSLTHILVAFTIKMITSCILASVCGLVFSSVTIVAEIEHLTNADSAGNGLSPLLLHIVPCSVISPPGDWLTSLFSYNPSVCPTGLCPCPLPACLP